MEARRKARERARGCRFETVCDCAEELKLQSPSCCLRPRQIYYHTRQQKTQTYASIVCVYVCVCAEGSGVGKRGYAGKKSNEMRQRLLQIKYFTWAAGEERERARTRARARAGCAG